MASRTVGYLVLATWRQIELFHRWEIAVHGGTHDLLDVPPRAAWAEEWIRHYVEEWQDTLQDRGEIEELRDLMRDIKGRQPRLLVVPDRSDVVMWYRYPNGGGPQDGDNLRLGPLRDFLFVGELYPREKRRCLDSIRNADEAARREWERATWASALPPVGDRLIGAFAGYPQTERVKDEIRSNAYCATESVVEDVMEDATAYVTDPHVDPDDAAYRLSEECATAIVNGHEMDRPTIYRRALEILTGGDQQRVADALAACKANVGNRPCARRGRPRQRRV